MTYFQELDAWLTSVLLTYDDENEEEWFARVKTQVKEKVLESYRNGQEAGLKPKPSTPDSKGKPRESRPGKQWPSRRSQRQ